MAEEDYFGSSSSNAESYGFSHDNRNQQYVSSRKENVSSGCSKKSPGNRDAPRQRFKLSDLREDDKRTTFSERVKPHVHKPSSQAHEGEAPCDAESVRDMSLDEIWKPPTPRRKSRQQLQKEKEAATAIQSAWRGYQVRREIDALDEAATQIQAAFRGYRTRKELPFRLCAWDSVPGQKLKKKMRGKSKSRSFPGLLNYFEQRGLAPESQSIFLPSGQRRSYPKNTGEDYTGLQPQVVLSEINSALRPHREMFTYGVLVPPAQKHHDAASIIQAAWRGHEIKQRATPAVLQGEKSLRNSYCSNFSIEKIYRKHMTSGHTLEQHEVRGIIAKSSAISFRNIPHVRNINIYALVKGMPMSPKPSVTIRVSSPNAVVQGYQKDMSGGVHGLYTIKNHYSQRPAQILIHVNLQKEKGLKSCP